MFFKNPFVYVQFHPLAYQIKLSIEMSLADLIAKVVRASHEITETHDFGSSAVSGPTDDWRNARLTVDGPGPSGCSIGAHGAEQTALEQGRLNGHAGAPTIWHVQDGSSGVVEMDSTHDVAPPQYRADGSSTRSLRIRSDM